MEVKKTAIAAVIAAATTFTPLANADVLNESQQTSYQATPFEHKTLGLISKLLIPTDREESQQYQDSLVKAFLEDNKDSDDILRDVKEEIGVGIDVPDSFRNQFNKNTFHFNTNDDIREATEKRQQIIENSLEYDNLQNTAVYGSDMADKRTESLVKNGSIMTIIDMSFGTTEIKVGNEDLVLDKQNKKINELKDTIEKINDDPMLSIELDKAKLYAENYGGYNAAKILKALTEVEDDNAPTIDSHKKDRKKRNKNSPVPKLN
jgi:hypothetical protein